MTNTLHAHVSTASADCDGPIYREYIETFNDDEIAEQVRAYVNGQIRGDGEIWNDFSDIHFMNRMLANVAGPYAARQIRVTIDESGIDVHEDTEEGYRNAEVRWCTDDCDPTVYSYRDVFAEQMGY